MTRRWSTAAALSIPLALLAAGCGSSSSSTGNAANSSAPASAGGAYGGGAYGGGAAKTPTQTTASAGAALTIATRSTPLGAILTGANGRTVYLFEKDSAGKSNCAGPCATAWMPVAAPATAGSGLTAAMLSTTARSDGTKQVVYGGHPLYYFISDTQPGDTKGEGVHAFGADWYEIGPAGRKVEKKGS